MISDAPQPGQPQTFSHFCHLLITADWEKSDGPLRLAADLTLPDLAHAHFFLNARVFLAALAENDGAPATATGNLNRKFIAGIFDSLKLSIPYLQSIHTVCKVINEWDLWPLHLVRVVSESAGLVARRKGKFQLTKTGRALLPEDQVGALFRKLFIAYFRRFDLRYDFHLRDVPDIQRTIPAILWRLHAIARDWKPVQGLAPEVLLPGVLEQMHKVMTYAHDTEEWILAGYVLNPLFNLGLIERKEKTEWSGITDKDVIRITEVWRKFITFP